MTLTTQTRELHQLRRQRSRILRLIEANPKRGTRWAMGQLAKCEQIKARIKDIERGMV